MQQKTKFQFESVIDGCYQTSTEPLLHIYQKPVLKSKDKVIIIRTVRNVETH